MQALPFINDNNNNKHKAAAHAEKALGARGLRWLAAFDDDMLIIVFPSAHTKKVARGKEI